MRIKDYRSGAERLNDIIVEILDGASYLFGVGDKKSSSVLEKEERMQQLFETLNFDYQGGDV